MTPEERDRLTRVETQVEALAADLHEIKADVKRIADAMAQARGGWRTLIAVGTVAGALGAGLARLWPFEGRWS